MLTFGPAFTKIQYEDTVKRKNKRTTRRTPGIKTPDVAEQASDTGNAGNDALFTRTDVFICSAIFISTIIVYILTLAPTVHFGDSGELTAAAYNLGIAHPPGYPLYLLLGKLFMLLIPFGDAAMRMNLLSAFFASSVAVLIYLINRVLSRGFVVSASVSMIAVFSFTFWSQAVVAEVYTLAAFFLCLMVLLTLLWFKRMERRWLLFLGLTAGLALTHHVIIAIFYPLFILFILLNRPRIIKDWKLMAKITVLFLLPLLLYLYLPLRSAANPVNDWGNPETFSAMWDHVTAKQFGGLFLKHGFDGLLFQLDRFIEALFNQFHFILLIMALAGLAMSIKGERKTALFFLALLAVNFIYATAYYITDIEPHFITIFLILALFAGKTLESFNSWARRKEKVQFRRIGVGIVIVLSLLPVALNWVKCDQGGNTLARDYGQNLMGSLEDNGVLFIDSETELFIAAYLKIVENVKPDVEVYDIRQNIFQIPSVKAKGIEASSMNDLYNFAADLVAKSRPVYFTNPVIGNFRFSDYGVLYRVIRGGEPPGSIGDPWEYYDLKGIGRVYHDAASKEIAGKYYLGRARYLAKTNQVDSALEFLDKALNTAGDRHIVLKQVYLMYMQLRRYDDAERLLKRAVKLDPFDPDGYNMLAMIAHHRAHYSEALVNYNKCLALKSDMPSVLINRGMLYEQMGDKETGANIKQEYYQKAYDDMELAAISQPSNPAIKQTMERLSGKLSR